MGELLWFAIEGAIASFAVVHNSPRGREMGPLSQPADGPVQQKEWRFFACVSCTNETCGYLPYLSICYIQSDASYLIPFLIEGSKTCSGPAHISEQKKFVSRIKSGWPS
jgi:hypothetical protein